MPRANRPRRRAFETHPDQRALCLPGLTMTARVVLSRLAENYHPRDGTAWRAYTDIADDLGISRDKVGRHLATARKSGYITLHRPAVNHRPPVWRLNLAVWPEPPSRVREQANQERNGAALTGNPHSPEIDDPFR